ncbi:MAG: hypothetical protein GF401_05025 [Chitinivibrionales bacterium]|nr:hypothetical protein [Chitinivibrionales bacterium]
MPFLDSSANELYTLQCESTIAPETRWDKFSWSNHNDYLCVQGDDGLNYVYILKLDRDTIMS